MPTPLPPSVYMNNDPKSFGWTTARSRWISIVSNAISDINETYPALPDGETDKKMDAEEVSRKLEKLKEDIHTSAEITPFADNSIPGLAAYDEELLSLGRKVTWSDAPWLFSECILYRKINQIFVHSQYWKDYDVFFNLKENTFKSSAFGVGELAVRYKNLSEKLTAGDDKADAETLEILFREFIEVSLWGNATDLSLLANATLEDIKSVQGAEARKKSESKILVNDTAKAWAVLADGKPGNRVDFVLDNSGFELYTDMVLALFLLDAGLVSEVVFHTKSIPWMVSDVTPWDFKALIEDMRDPTFFPDHRAELDFLADRVEYHISGSRIKERTHPFWTSFDPFWQINPHGLHGGSEVWSDLVKSDLVIFKGDLNYRKLTGDYMWPRETPFVDAIRELADSGVRLLSLRTCKADVCVGLKPGQDKELEKEYVAMGFEPPEGWVWSGKWAVISYSEGKIEEAK